MRELTEKQAYERLRVLRAHLVEVVHVNGALRFNVVLRSGRPQTWRVVR